MTVSELYNSVAQLGFEDSLEDDDRFFFAANRALLQVNALRPATGVYALHHDPMPNKLRENTFEPVKKYGELCFEACGVKAFYFEADGIGEMIAERWNGEKWETVNSRILNSYRTFKSYFGSIPDGEKFISDLARLRFVGDYLYSVKNVAMYEHLLSDRDEDIPAYEPHTRYDMRVLVPDFLAFEKPTVRRASDGEYLYDGYSIENGGTVLLPYEQRGLYDILYQRRPKKLEYEEEAAKDETKIDLDEDLCALLPVLIASYIWVDDEPEKAAYYLDLYRERAAFVESRKRDPIPASVRSVNGW